MFRIKEVWLDKNKKIAVPPLDQLSVKQCDLVQGSETVLLKWERGDLLCKCVSEQKIEEEG